MLNTAGATRLQMLDSNNNFHCTSRLQLSISSQLNFSYSYWKTQSLHSHENHGPMCHAKFWQGPLIKHSQKMWNVYNKDKRSESRSCSCTFYSSPIKPVRHYQTLCVLHGHILSFLCLNLGLRSSTSALSPSFNLPVVFNPGLKSKAIVGNWEAGGDLLIALCS